MKQIVDTYLAILIHLATFFMSMIRVDAHLTDAGLLDPTIAAQVRTVALFRVFVSLRFDDSRVRLRMKQAEQDTMQLEFLLTA